MRRLRALSPIWHDRVAYAVGDVLPEMGGAQAAALVAAGAAVPADAGGADEEGASEGDRARDPRSEGGGLAAADTPMPAPPTPPKSPAAVPPRRRGKTVN